MEKLAVRISNKEVLENVMPRILPMDGEEMIRGADMYTTDWFWFKVGYYVDFEGSADREGENDKFLIISNAFLKASGISGEELQKAALENIDAAATVRDIDHMLADICGDRADNEDIKPGMIIVTNRQKAYGAAAMMSGTAMDMVSGLYGGKFAILPSSVHEIIAVPWAEDLEPMNEMVRTVNHDQVEPIDRLYDAAFVYEGGSIRKTA